jgi:hypothetical protein
MLPVIKELGVKLCEITGRVSVFCDSVAKDKLPSYLLPGSNFLGKYEVSEIIPYSRIINEKLWTLPSVFEAK